MKLRLPRSNWMRAGIVVALVSWSIVGYILFFTNSSDGYRDGVVQTFRKKATWGFIKTWEGELALPGFGGSHQRGSAQAAGTWAFSVTDAAVVGQLQALPPDAYVRVYYHQLYPIAAVPWKGETDYRVDRIERTGDPDERAERATRP